MKERIFIDTSFWIALFDKNDQFHSQAIAGLCEIENNFSALCSDFIIYETITYLNCSLTNHGLALKFLNAIKSSNLTVWDSEKNIKNEAMQIFKNYVDKSFSFTDCVSFALMHKKDIKTYAGFDNHFSQMGYTSIY